MDLPRPDRLRTLVSLAGLVFLIACGSAGDGTTTTPATCAGCDGALCGSTCTDLSPRLADEVESKLPASACVAQATVSGATVCSAQTCPPGGAPGCTVALSWSAVALGHDTHLLEGTVTGTSNVDAHLSGTDCAATVTALLSYKAGATFACAPGAETATFATATTKVESSSVTPDAACALLGVYLDQFRPTFEAAAQNALKDALAQATASVTATCPTSLTHASTGPAPATATR